MSRHRGNGNLRKAAGVVLASFILFSYFTPWAASLRALPDTLQLSQGQVRALIPGNGLLGLETKGSVQVLSSSDERLGDQTSIKGDRTGLFDMSINLFGLFPVKRVQVSVLDQKTLIPGGQAVGVALKTAGVLVVGVSDLSGSGRSPAALCGIQAGDVIQTVDQTAVTSAEQLSQMIRGGGEQARTIELLRGEDRLSVSLTPKLDAASGSLRMGMWVRDSTAGVGTMAYYDPETKGYGALGHAITDGDTGSLLTVGEGQIMAADIVSVKRGQRGDPGELKGSFLLENRLLGTIQKNTALGIYGTCDQPIQQPLYPDGLPVGLQSAVHTGPAEILSTVDEGGVASYQVEIIKVTSQSRPSSKGMIVQVTDPALIAKTGGIVQGMSGSPIIQDGHIIGAVTHVFVNDPTKGYGVFIEWMLEKQ